MSFASALISGAFAYGFGSVSDHFRSYDPALIAIAMACSSLLYPALGPYPEAP